MARIIETRENHKLPELRTRFYRANQNTCKQAIYKTLESMNLRVVHENDRYGEIAFAGRDFRGQVEMFSLKPGEYGIDLFVEYLKTFNFGKNKKLVIEFHEKIKKDLTLNR